MDWVAIFAIVSFTTCFWYQHWSMISLGNCYKILQALGTPDVLLVACYISPLSPDERDDFTRYREDLCDVAETLQRTMHVEYLQHLSDQLSALLGSSTTPPWQVHVTYTPSPLSLQYSHSFVAPYMHVHVRDHYRQIPLLKWWFSLFLVIKLSTKRIIISWLTGAIENSLHSDSALLD